MAKPKPTSLGVSPGDVLLGKYQVDRVLGSGGMGVVAQATHLQLGEKVAIKFLRADMVADEPTLARFLREAQAAARLKSEHVARVTDVGTIENGAPYMVMEFLEGEDVAQTLAERGAMHVPFAIDLTMQACVALAEAHSLGIIHRDIKPTNLFITWRPDGGAQLKILDFGISKVVEPGQEMSLTSTMSLLGTPAYMAPEQMRSAREVDPRSDIWSLGTVLYEMVEGRRPFFAETFTEMCVRVISDPPAPLTAQLPDGLTAAILRCLAKDPAERYQSVGELASDLAPLARDPMAAYDLVKRIDRMLARRDSIPRAIVDVGSAPIGKRGVARGPAPAASRGSGEFSDQSTDIDSAALDDRAPPTPRPGADVPSVMLTTGRPRGDTVPNPERDQTAPAVMTDSVATSIRPRRRGLWIGVALALAGAAGLAVVVGGGSPKDPGTAPAAGVVPDSAKPTTRAGSATGTGSGSASVEGSAAAAGAGSATATGSAAGSSSSQDVEPIARPIAPETKPTRDRPRKPAGERPVVEKPPTKPVAVRPILCTTEKDKYKMDKAGKCVPR